MKCEGARRVQVVLQPLHPTSLKVSLVSFLPLRKLRFPASELQSFSREKISS